MGMNRRLQKGGEWLKSLLEARGWGVQGERRVNWRKGFVLRN